MGSHFFWKLFLLLLWEKWINKNKKADIGKAKFLGTISRFIEGPTAGNDLVEFERSFHKSYHHESELKNEHFDYLEGSFLDFAFSFFSCTYALPSY